MFTRLDRYLMRQILIPLAMTLGVAALLLLLERMLRLFDFVVNQGGPVRVVFQMLGTLVPHYLSLALPLGLFLGILLAFRKMSMNSELDALRGSGVGLGRLMRPVMALTLLLMTLNVVLTGFVQPQSRFIYRSLVFDLRSGALGASIKVGEFVNLGDDLTLRVEQSRQSGSELLGIFMQRSPEEGRTFTVTAERGAFFSTSDEQTVILRLYDGRLIDMGQQADQPRVLTFDTQDIAIDLPTISGLRQRGEEYLELTLPELTEAMNDPLLPASERRASLANFHWRLMHSLTFVLLPFLAIPLGITNKRTGKSSGLVVGLSMIIVYNEFSEVTETMVAGGTNPYVSIWLLFGLLALVSGRWYYMRAYRVGSEPLDWLDRAWSNLADRLKRILRHNPARESGETA